MTWTRPPALDNPGHFIKGGELEAVLDQIDSLTPPAWTNIALLAGWTNRAGYAVAGYRRVQGDTALQLILNLAAGTQANGTIIFTLPDGWRPLSTVQLSISTRIAAVPQQMGTLEIDSSGNAKIFDIGASAVLHGSGSVPLDR